MRAPHSPRECPLSLYISKAHTSCTDSSVFLRDCSSWSPRRERESLHECFVVMRDCGTACSLRPSRRWRVPLPHISPFLQHTINAPLLVPRKQFQTSLLAYSTPNSKREPLVAREGIIAAFFFFRHLPPSPRCCTLVSPPLGTTTLMVYLYTNLHMQYTAGNGAFA